MKTKDQKAKNVEVADLHRIILIGGFIMSPQRPALVSGGHDQEEDDDEERYGKAVLQLDAGSCHHSQGGGEKYHFNPLVPRVQKIEIRKLDLTDFYWLNF